MTIQSDLRTVTDRIIAARAALAEAEEARIMARLDMVKVWVPDLDIERRRLMASPDAGTNDTARRAYADHSTRNMAQHLDTLRTNLAYTERDVLEATAALRMAEDERRYLELVLSAGRDDRDDRAALPRLLHRPRRRRRQRHIQPARTAGRLATAPRPGRLTIAPASVQG